MPKERNSATGERLVLTRREVIRELMPYTKSRTSIGVLLFLSDWIPYWLGILGVLYLPGLGWKIAASVLAATRLPNLITLGHDAAHGALTAHKYLNWTLGVLCLTPCFMNYRLWVFDHHVLHHRNTNHDHKDTWTPISREEYNGLSRFMQWAHRFYRHPNPVSLAVYYMKERWAYSKILPLAHVDSKYRASAWRHFLFICSYAITFVTALALAPLYAEASASQALLLGLILPFFVEMAAFSWILWAMHTLPEVGWFRPPFSSTKVTEASELVSVHLKVPRWFEIATHGITNHPVHHLLPAIPIYRLSAAQSRYSQLVGDLNVEHRLTLKNLLDTARRCKLYDFKDNCWRDFEGNVTSTQTRPFSQSRLVEQYLGGR